MKRRKITLTVAATPDVMTRVVLEHFRECGDFRRLVVSQLRCGLDPAPADLAKALQAPQPDPTQDVHVTLTARELAAVCAADANGTQRPRLRVSAARQQQAIAEQWQIIANDTALLCDYAARLFVEQKEPRRTGRKPGTSRSFAHDSRIAETYYRALAANPQHRTLVKHEIATQLKISVRTLEAILLAFPEALVDGQTLKTQR